MSRTRLVAVLASVAGACALSAPAALAQQQSAPSDGKGVVLSVAHHSLRLVDRAHRVADVRVGSTTGLRRGDLVTVRKGRARVSGRVRKVAFLGRVVRSSGRGAVVRLGDGSTFSVGGGRRHGRRARSAASVTIDFQGLEPGQALLVTIATDEAGNVVLTIKLLPKPTDIGDGELHAIGVVTDDEGDGLFGIATEDGAGLRFRDPDRLLEAAGAAWCDVVDVAFHKERGKLVADELRVTGASDEGDCAEDEAFDELDGTVLALAGDGSSLTVAPDDGGGATTVAVEDPSLLDGIEVGDEVAVTLDEDGVAIDVELLGWEDDPGDDGEE